MTYEEKVESIKQNRSNALNQRVSLQNARVSAVDEDDFNNKYLWGDGTNIGIQDLIKYYYQEKNAEVGRTWSSPSLSNYTESYWESLLEDAIDTDGDGSGGFYPNGSQDQQINTSSVYLNDNGDNGETSGGLVQDITNIDTIIGQEATVTGTHTSTQTFGDATTAEDAAEEFLYGGNDPGYTVDTGATPIEITGSGIRGRRTRDVEIGTSGTYNFTIGDGSIDEPDFFADTTDVNGYGGNEKTDLINYIDTLITNLESYRDNILTPLRDELDNIFDGTNELFDDMKSKISDDSGNLDTLISNINGYIGSSGDTVSADTLYGYYNYFNGADGTETDFDTQLTNLETLNSSIDTEISNRTSGLINTYVGDTYSDKMKFWRYFWIKERIGKPVASLISINGIDTGISNAEDTLSNKNDSLENLIGNTDSDRQEWIPQPEVYAAYFNPIFNVDDGSIIQLRTGVVFSGQQHATEYEIFRDLVDNISLNNNEWSNSLKIADYTKVADNGYVSQEYVDTNVSQDETYVYRVRVYDDTNDPNYTFSGSAQSKIYDDINPVSYTFQNDETLLIDGTSFNTSKVNIEKETDFAVGSYTILFSSSGDNDDIYSILKTQENQTDMSVWIYPALTTEEDGNLHYFKCIATVSQ
jgi:hypothetical protein